MLISKTVIVKWQSRNKNWYINKGYKFTKINDEFEVRVEDLTDGSHVLVNVECDCPDCTTLINKPIKWQNYLKYVHEDGSYYCCYCAKKLYGAEIARKSKLKNGKSFYDWCIENNRLDVLARWNYELNKVKPYEISYASSIKLWFNCPRNIHEPELKSISQFTKGQEGSIKCNKCNSIGQYLIDVYGEDAIEKYWDYENNNALRLNAWNIDKGSKTKVYIKCQEKSYHGSYPIKCNDFVTGSRCPYCATFHGKVHPLDSLGKLLEDKGLLYLWSEKNKKSPYEYTPWSSQEVWWKCPNGKHDDYKREISVSNVCEFRCPECVQERKESILQEKTRLYLEKLGYKVFHEERCSIVPINPKTKHTLPFDNEIILLNGIHLIIEVNGIQHYKINGFHYQQAKVNNTTLEQEFHYQQLKDRYKRFIAYKRGYEYLEIPYWTDDKDETYKNLIDNKIKTYCKEVS